MKKISILVLFLLLTGCQKEIDMPKLKAKTLTIQHEDSIDLNYETLIDTDRLNDTQMEELEKNGEIDASSLVYDSEGKIQAGTYDIVVSYYDDVVDCILTVEDPNLPIFNDISEVEVPWSYMYWDFNQNIASSSPIGLPITLTFDTSAIDFYTTGDYTLIATATDSEGRVATKEIIVHIY